MHNLAAETGIALPPVIGERPGRTGPSNKFQATVHPTDWILLKARFGKPGGSPAVARTSAAVEITLGAVKN